MLPGGGGGGGQIEIFSILVTSEMHFKVEPGRSNCNDSRIGRYCDPVYQGLCSYKVLNESFDEFSITNPWLMWINEPLGSCLGGKTEFSLKERERLTHYNPVQGKCWDVSLSKSGWLRIFPRHNRQFFVNDTAHRLAYQLPGNSSFDVETRMVLMNNDSSCVIGGLYVLGVVHGVSNRSPWHFVSPDGVTMEWVKVGVLDTGDTGRLQVSVLSRFAFCQLTSLTSGLHTEPSWRKSSVCVTDFIRRTFIFASKRAPTKHLLPSGGRMQKPSGLR